MKTAEGKHLNENASNYDKDAYEKASNTVDICICSVIDDDLKILLIKRKHPPFKNMWAIPGGFVNISDKETLETSAKRELKEETGITNIPVRQLGTYGEPNRDPRMRIITTVYYALMSNKKIKKQKIKAADDAKEYKWVSLYNLPKLAFDYNKILNDLLFKLKIDIKTTPVAFELVDNKFTWRDLQKIYECILNKKLLSPNFRRKIKSMYDIIQIDEKYKSDIGRHPHLLKYLKEKELSL